MCARVVSRRLASTASLARPEARGRREATHRAATRRRGRSLGLPPKFALARGGYPFHNSCTGNSKFRNRPLVDPVPCWAASGPSLGHDHPDVDPSLHVRSTPGQGAMFPSEVDPVIERPRANASWWRRDFRGQTHTNSFRMSNTLRHWGLSPGCRRHGAKRRSSLCHSWAASFPDFRAAREKTRNKCYLKSCFRVYQERPSSISLGGQHVRNGVGRMWTGSGLFLLPHPTPQTRNADRLLRGVRGRRALAMAAERSHNTSLVWLPGRWRCLCGGTGRSKR